MAHLEKLLQDYAALESEIRTLMSHLFSGTCGMCTACCCRADICEEATESAFLALLLQKQGLDEKDMDERYGWLDLHGCSLQYGRPPVCYAFFCDELLARLPDHETRFSAGVLGKLLHHIGQKALGGWHLVEIMDPADLEKINFERIFQRLKESQSAFEVIAEYIETGSLGSSARKTLSVITTEEP